MFNTRKYSGRWLELSTGNDPQLIQLWTHASKALNQSLALNLLQCKSISMGLFSILKSTFGTRRIDSPASAQAFLESRAAFLVQKSISEYTQARANMMFSTLLGEKNFQTAYEAARWKSYPAGLSMVAEVFAAAFRVRLGVSPALATTVVQQYLDNIICKMRGHGPLLDADWDHAREAANQDLARAQLGQPHGAHAIAFLRAKEIFDALPFHTAIRQHDFAMFRNTIAFHLAEIAAELESCEMEASAAKLSLNPPA